MRALSKVMCHQGYGTVLAFGNIFSTLSLMQMMKASMTSLGRAVLTIYVAGVELNLFHILFGLVHPPGSPGQYALT